MNLSTFDLATHFTGWCSGAGDGLPTVGAFEFVPTGDDIGRLLAQFEMALDTHFLAFAPVMVAYEAPILVVKHANRGTDKLLTIRKLYNLGGFLEWYCRKRGIPCVEADLRQIKKELTGDSLADKDAMCRAARKLGLTLPAKGADDAADAFGLWLLLLRTVSREKATRFDKALWGARGALLL